MNDLAVGRRSPDGSTWTDIEDADVSHLYTGRTATWASSPAGDQLNTRTENARAHETAKTVQTDGIGPECMKVLAHRSQNEAGVRSLIRRTADMGCGDSEQ